MEEERFLYEIRPVRPVSINGRMTRVPTSINLTKNEVMKYLAYGAVYRRFGATELVKVTGANLNKLHRAKDDANKDIIPENPGEINLGMIIEKHAPKIEVAPEEIKEAVSEIAAESPVETVAEEDTTEEVTDAITETVEEEAMVDDDTDDEDEEETSEDVEEKRTILAANVYHGNKKKHKHNR